MGKVHGSLARAGKVKSQTPKVEKQEKKKTPYVETSAQLFSKRNPGHSLLFFSFWSKGSGHDGITGINRACIMSNSINSKGRAKKRLTYTRRFVNITLTGGKRKMNPNPTS
ncbi:hypothetical protein QBC38DRAFT_127208 [Podospora fimiseda]|uniref:40S ribosomal protein S30 n=1 Tax=Podospora fimiseda TaxID=252190 RepID=A0AAN7H266_9PEZI|nr:hypothetical protein QBC38DRAFT_127208 [Podospora fimiseda]